MFISFSKKELKKDVFNELKIDNLLSYQNTTCEFHFENEKLIGFVEKYGCIRKMKTMYFNICPIDFIKKYLVSGNNCENGTDNLILKL